MSEFWQGVGVVAVLASPFIGAGVAVAMLEKIFGEIDDGVLADVRDPCPDHHRYDLDV